jgi:hypothetical protein
MVLRVVLGLIITAGFEFVLAWLFLGGPVLFFALVGYLLLGPDTCRRQPRSSAR